MDLNEYDGVSIYGGNGSCCGEGDDDGRLACAHGYGSQAATCSTTLRLPLYTTVALVHYSWPCMVR